ncbi:hypothetical protein [Microbulbifer hainanensis]|uniref:hypothetical protein n=1 Tax=Microbulbifer hainanensis TaxID=2735675 RepID=UPI0018688235|nr:hypothetical protein [Microbulbifer hainanensis]
MNTSRFFPLAALAMALSSAPAFAGIDKVYSPQVELGELELEMRGVHGLNSSDAHEVNFGIGYGVTQNWFVEGYLIGEKEDGNFEIEEAEIESKFQLSETGEYWADFGALVELEKKLEEDVWEIKAGPIIQKRVGKIVATANILLEQQFGDDKTEDEVEPLGSFQLRYRMGPSLEPAVEYYADEYTQAAGPVLLGNNRFGNSTMKWELGVMFALNDETEDATLRWQAEFEF